MEVAFDDVAKLAQEYLRERPVVVLGCGASAPYGLPTMPQLAAALLSRVECNDVAWRKFKEELANDGDLERALHQVELPDPVHREVIDMTWTIVGEKDGDVFARVLADPQTLVLSRLFRFLLRVARPHVSVVTTNYDRLAEYAADLADATAFTGFRPGWLQRFVPGADPGAPLRPLLGIEGRIDIWKVHGSLDWFLDESGNPVAVPFAGAIPAGCRPLMVTPGVSKYRDVLVRDPFRTVMSQADSALKRAGSYLCIGYGFNDEHVQPILLNRVTRENVPLVLVTKRLTDAARRAVLNGRCKKFLLFEEHIDGATVFYPASPSGAILKARSAWDLAGFLDMLQADRDY